MPRLAPVSAVGLALAALCLAFGTACNAHPLGGSADAGPQISEHGISVPVPPPSLWAAPVQRVDIEGELGVSNPEPGTVVFLLDAYREPGAFVAAESDGSFRFEGIEIDLGNNCLELWAEEPGPYGEMSVHSFFHARIADDDQTVVTEQFFEGC